MTLDDVVVGYFVLSKVFYSVNNQVARIERDWPLKIKYRLTKAFGAYEPEYLSYDKIRIELVKKYGKEIVLPVPAGSPEGTEGQKVLQVPAGTEEEAQFINELNTIVLEPVKDPAVVRFTAAEWDNFLEAASTFADLSLSGSDLRVLENVLLATA